MIDAPGRICNIGRFGGTPQADDQVLSMYTYTDAFTCERATGACWSIYVCFSD